MYKLDVYISQEDFSKQLLNDIYQDYKYPISHTIVYGPVAKILSITIGTTYWQTWWFIVLSLIFVLFFTYLYIIYRENKLKERHKLDLLQQRLLRSQMNPHFIFNSLAAIQSYIYDHEPIEAASYLSQFADLMRSIITNSRVDFIPIINEIETLINYMRIQQIRFENKFDFVVKVDPRIDVDFLAIPPMLIQPLIENSIEHGFNNLIIKGNIDIEFTKTMDSIHISVKDNGVGLETDLNEKLKSKNHISFAIDTIRARLDILNNEKKGEYGIAVKNIMDKYGKVIGVKASFNVPIIYH